MATSSTITIKRGNTWGQSAPITLQYEDGTPYALPVGAILLFTVKTAQDSAQNDDAALIKKDVTSSYLLSATDTDIPEGMYRYDLKVVGTGIERNTASGIFIIEPRVGVRDV